MIKYLLLLVPNIIMWILGVVLAPFLPIFCNDKGELPDCLYWFTTWDAPHLVFDSTGEIQADFSVNNWPILEKISNEKLKPAFGWFVLIMGIYIILKETLLK